MEFLTPELIKAVLNAGTSVVLALVVIYWYREDSLSQVQDQKERANEERSDKLTALEIIKENTNAISNNTHAINRVAELCNCINNKV